MFANSQNIAIAGGSFTNVNNYYGQVEAEGTGAGLGGNPARRKLKEVKICPLPVPTFTGRRDILDKMARFFDSGTGSQRVFVLHGLGGSGKSQLAFKFLQESTESKRFSNVFYIDATNEQTLRMDLGAIFPGDAEPSAEASLRWLANQPCEANWALFFDNADDVQLKLRKFLPPCSSGNVLVTTRNQDLRILAGRNGDVNVTDLQAEEAKLLLLDLSDVDHTEENEAMATQIVQDLHFFALAISQAGAFIRVNSSLSDYQRLFRRERDNLLQDVEFQGRDPYEYAVYTTWSLSYDKLDTASRTLLHICSLLHHEGISEEMFERAALCHLEGWEEVELGDLSPVTELLNQLGKQGQHWSSYTFRQVVKHLGSYSLLEYDRQNSTYSIHPLVQDWSRGTLGTQLQEMQNRITTLICLSTPWQNHIQVKDHNYRRTLFKHLSIPTSPTDMPIFVASCLAIIYANQGLVQKVEPLELQVLEQRKFLLGEDHPKTLDSMSELAGTYWQLGRLKDAEVLLMQVHEKRKLLLGEDHPDTLSAKAYLAGTYSKRGQQKDAEVLEVQVLEKRKLLLDEDHPDTLEAMGNLASTYRNLGRPKDAEVLEVQVLERRKLFLGEDHPDTLEAMGNLALTYQQLGRLKDAEVLEVQVFERRKLLLGEDHPDTLWVMGNLASTYSKLGQQKDAEMLKVQVLEKRKLLLGKDHPDTLRAMANLAYTYWQLGRLTDAEVLEVQVLEKRKLLLGEDHPDTLLAMGNLAYTYWQLGRQKDAEVLEVQVLEKRKLLLGEDHPDTLRAMANLAATYVQLGHQNKAEVLEVQVLEKRKLLLGEDHPYTLKAMENLAETYRNQGKIQEAEALDSKVKELKT